MSDIDKMIECLRDDAPVYPMWTIGELKAWRDKARIDEVEKIKAEMLENVVEYELPDEVVNRLKELKETKDEGN